MHSNKIRLDHLVKERYPALSKTLINSLIMQGQVLVEGVPATKAGQLVSPEIEIRVNLPDQRFVCRAGYKIEAALDHFQIDPANLVILDAGLSTGGFTDCLLQRGAKRVYGVDVGYGQAHEKIRADKRVIVMERTNLRHLNYLPEKPQLVTLDLSFISLLKVLPAVVHLMDTPGKLITLIKPQFEAARHQIGKGGIVRDPAVHQEVINKIIAGAQELGLEFHGVIDSPILGTTGNKEFLAYFTKTRDLASTQSPI